MLGRNRFLPVSASRNPTLIICMQVLLLLVVLVVVLFKVVVVRPNSTIDQNSKPRNTNRWTQNVCIERILYIQCNKREKSCLG